MITTSAGLSGGVSLNLTNGAWKNVLDNHQVIAYSVCLIGLMLGLSVLRTNKWPDLKISTLFQVQGTLTPRRVSGD